MALSAPPPPPPHPRGFCHLFTDDWPLHRYDLNVSYSSHNAPLPPPALSFSLYPVILDVFQFPPPFFFCSHSLWRSAKCSLTSLTAAGLSAIYLPLSCVSVSPLLSLLLLTLSNIIAKILLFCCSNHFWGSYKILTQKQIGQDLFRFASGPSDLSSFYSFWSEHQIQ